ncbi:hypothetical protein HAX54_016372 [Datura stramonium]|uniref:Uncharacterized protein n=1 Tax=Datura stramonium TaxID=4076 RepID=A0ABS8S082_DATST|nr:hypothetical protein [Datura stramonium]
MNRALPVLGSCLSPGNMVLFYNLHDADRGCIIFLVIADGILEWYDGGEDSAHVSLTCTTVSSHDQRSGRGRGRPRKTKQLLMKEATNIVRSVMVFGRDRVPTTIRTLNLTPPTDLQGTGSDKESIASKLEHEASVETEAKTENTRP